MNAVAAPAKEVSLPVERRSLFGSMEGWIRLGWYLFLRDFRYLAGQNVLGFFWLLTKPVMAAAPFILIGGHFKLGGKDQGSYTLFAATGFLLWHLFWGAIQNPPLLLRRCRKIAQGLPLPSGALLAATAFYILMESSVMILLVAVLSAFHASFGPSQILAVLSMPFLVLSGYSLGMWLAPMELFSRDLRYSLPYVARFFLMTAPIFYVMPEGGMLRLINKLNPLTYLIGVPRSWLVSGFSPDDPFFLAAVAFFSVFFVVGMKFNRRAMRIAAERIGDDLL